MTDWLADRSGEVPRLLARVRPGEEVESLVQLGEGTDHVAYEVNWELIVRFVTDPDPAGRAEHLRTEAGVLAEVKALTPPAVPEPLHVVPEDGVMIYRKIPGTPLLHLRSDLPHLDLATFGQVMGEFLGRLHQAPVAAFEDFAPREDATLDEWRGHAQQEYDDVIDWVPITLRPSVETFLAQPPPAEPQVATFCHNDLGIEHILVDPNGLAVSGIIDWADAAITDPAVDLAKLYRDLGPQALASILANYSGMGEGIETFRRRVEFLARCTVFDDMSYGLLPGHDAYLQQGISALHWLFLP